jgi:hypothetical protein
LQVRTTTRGRNDDLNRGIGVHKRQRFFTVAGEEEVVMAVADLAAKAPTDQKLHVGFVIDDENLGRHVCPGSVVSP